MRKIEVNQADSDSDLLKAIERLSKDALSDLSALVDQLKNETNETVRKEIIQTIGEILQPQLLIATKKKAYYWNCNCGCLNIAPALQTADNVVVCDKCKKQFKWCKVRTPKPITAS